jgi:hypothetical protein
MGLGKLKQSKVANSRKGALLGSVKYTWKIKISLGLLKPKLKEIPMRLRNAMTSLPSLWQQELLA